MLHATFWSHGAGDLEIPPSAGMAPPPPPGSPLGHDSNGGSSMETRQRQEARQEAPFLDFLYPPQALAWAHKAHGQPRDSWEGRSVRRLPGGFAQTTRQYRSMATSSKFPNAQEEESSQEAGTDVNALEQKIESGPVVHVECSGLQDDLESRDGSSHGPEDTRVVATHDQAIAEDSEHAPVKDAARAGLLDFGDSPADLAEQSTDKLRRLRNLLSRKSSADDEQWDAEEADKAWDTYESLDAEARENANVMSDLLKWMSRNTSDVAATHTAWLYRQIPKDAKTLPVYLAALNTFTRRGNYVLAVKLHKEALKNAECGPDVSEALFRHMVEQKEWRLAIHVQQYHVSVYSGGNKNALADSVWRVLEGMPDLVNKANSLIQYTRRLERARTFDTHSRTFGLRFARETLRHRILKLDHESIKTMRGNNGIPRAKLRNLFLFIAENDKQDAAREFLMGSLMHMLRHVSDKDYPHLHHVVSFVFYRYCKARGRPNQDTIGLFLERLTRYPKTLLNSPHSITVTSLINTWLRYHGALDVRAVNLLIWYHARRGEVDSVDRKLEQLQALKPSWTEYNRGLSATIYVHARRADVEKADAAFDYVRQVTLANGQTVAAQCWNILIHAYSRADNLEGALRVFEQMLASDTTPDEYSFHAVLQMYAQRGDAEAVEELLKRYDEVSQKERTTALVACLINAYTNIGNVDQAEQILRETLAANRAGNVIGSMTGLFNIVLTAHALRRSIHQTMSLYNLMKAEEIRLSIYTYATLMQALSAYRRTDSAYNILIHVMAKEGLTPTAFHYALVMVGYTNQGLYDRALEIHEKMLNSKIQPSFSSNMAYLKAKALSEHATSERFENAMNVPMPLENTINELQRMLPKFSGSDLAIKQPQIGRDISDLTSEVPGAYFNFLIFIHGKRQCFEAVEKLLEMYQTADGKASAVPLRLLTAVMSAYWRAGDFDEVERLWNLAKAQANTLAQTAPVPDLKPLADDDAVQENPVTVQLSKEQIITSTTPPTEPIPETKSVSVANPTALARRHLLSRPLRYQMASLASQGRLSELIKTVTNLLTHGYILDNRTWNAFVEHLCRASTPLTLLAFTLCERFLIPDWPGWRRRKPRSTRSFPPKPEQKFQGLEHIRASYLRPGQLVPQYRTLVWLGSALLGLRHRETVGGVEKDVGGDKELLKHVGTMRLVREKAPRTLYVVQSMPTVDDDMQRRLLRRE